MANLSMIETSSDGTDRRGLVRLPVEASEVLLDAGEAFDAEAARERIRRKLAAARTEGDKARQKLGNPSFLEKAPADVREKVQTQAAEADRRVAAFTQQLDGLG
jgi:valyl-tRNA synthetase